MYTHNTMSSNNVDGCMADQEGMSSRLSRISRLVSFLMFQSVPLNESTYIWKKWRLWAAALVMKAKRLHLVETWREWKRTRKVEKSAKKSTFEWRVTIKSYVQPKPQCKLVFPLKMVSSIHIPWHWCKPFKQGIIGVDQRPLVSRSL